MMHLKLLSLLLLGLLASCTNDKPAPKEPAEDTEDETVGDGASDDADAVADDEAAAASGVAVPEPPPEAVPSQPTAAQQPVKADVTPPPAVGASTLYYVSSKTLNVKEEASDASKTKSTLVKGDRVTVVSVENEWARLGSGGFVSTKGITKTVVGAERKTGGWKNSDASAKSVPTQKPAGKDKEGGK